MKKIITCGILLLLALAVTSARTEKEDVQTKPKKIVDATPQSDDVYIILTSYTSPENTIVRGKISRCTGYRQRAIMWETYYYSPFELLVSFTHFIEKWEGLTIKKERYARTEKKKDFLDKVEVIDFDEIWESMTPEDADEFGDKIKKKGKVVWLIDRSEKTDDPDMIILWEVTISTSKDITIFE